MAAFWKVEKWKKRNKYLVKFYGKKIRKGPRIPTKAKNSLKMVESILQNIQSLMTFLISDGKNFDLISK